LLKLPAKRVVMSNRGFASMLFFSPVGCVREPVRKMAMPFGSVKPPSQMLVVVLSLKETNKPEKIE